MHDCYEYDPANNRTNHSRFKNSKFDWALLQRWMHWYKGRRMCSFCCLNHRGLRYSNVSCRSWHYCWHTMRKSKKNHHHEKGLYSVPMWWGQEKRLELDLMPVCIMTIMINMKSLISTKILFNNCLNLNFSIFIYKLKGWDTFNIFSSEIIGK